MGHPSSIAVAPPQLDQVESRQRRRGRRHLRDQRGRASLVALRDWREGRGAHWRPANNKSPLALHGTRKAITTNSNALLMDP